MVGYHTTFRDVIPGRVWARAMQLRRDRSICIITDISSPNLLTFLRLEGAANRYQHHPVYRQKRVHLMPDYIQCTILTIGSGSFRLLTSGKVEFSPFYTCNKVQLADLRMCFPLFPPWLSQSMTMQACLL